MRLLLTVTRPSEVPTALGAGADVVDVKDPGRGSLGPPAPEVLRRVARRLAGRAPLGVPLGDGPHRAEELRRAAERAARVGASYLKVGVMERGGGTARDAGGDGSGRASVGPDARTTLDAVLEALSGPARHPAVIAVTFADAPEEAGPSPGELLDTAAAAGVDGVMLDTLGKEGRSVVDLVGAEELGRWCAAARSRGLLAALSGGLDEASVERLAGTGADVVGIRGGACVGGRAGRLAPRRCRAIRRAVDRAAAG